jgi:transcriptional regulator with XRE-family HTH domain
LQAFFCYLALALNHAVVNLRAMRKTSPLRQARKAAKVTLERLAEDVGISVSQLSRFETGERVPRVPELQRIADRLGVPVASLSGGASVLPPHREPQGLNDEQAHVVHLVIRAFLAWTMADPILQAKMREPAYQGAVARIIAQCVRSQRLHQAVARDDEAALESIRLVFETMPEQ